MTYTVRALAGLPTGTQIRSVALISFDSQSLIATNQIDPLNPGAGTDPAAEALVTLDAGLPSSAVSPLPTYVPEGQFLVTWAGQDDPSGSGVATFSVFVSINGGAFQSWLTDTTLTQAPYTGVAFSAYAFYSVATDNVGQQESTPLAADTQTTAAPIPHAQGLQVNDGNVQRSMVNSLTLTFDNRVTLDTGALGLTRRGGGNSFSVAISNPSGDGQTYILTFSGSGVVGGSLADGTYDVLVHADKVHSQYGIAMASDRTFTFTRLFGDSDGDGDVDKIDWALFKAAQGTHSGDPGYIWWFDYNGDGAIGREDLSQFLKRLVRLCDPVPA